VVGDAFSHDGRDGHEEVDIVVDTWSLGAGSEGLELVADADGAVVGHVLAALGDLDGRDVVAVAPLAVAPSHQGAGIGTALMTELLGRLERAGFPLVVLLGSPAYYRRFGFEPSGPLGIVYRPVGPGHPHFQVRRLSQYDPDYRGEFTYCWEVRPG
jgi:putative acetyltransferase